MAYVGSETRFCTLRARSGIFFHELNFFTKTFKLFYWSEALKSRFEVAYVVHKTRLGALRARTKRDFFHEMICFAETVPMRYRTPLGGFAKCVLFRRQADREGERTLRKYIYR